MPDLDLGLVVGPQGPKGDDGAAGPQGPKGDDGAPGPNSISLSTSTNITGLLAGDGSHVAVATLDSFPTANSGNPVTSGGVRSAYLPITKAEYDLLDPPDPNVIYFITDDQGGDASVYSQAQTDALLAMKTPMIGKGINLLDNWYFLNPVNQRGKSSYNTAGFLIDRWYISSATTVTVSNGLTIDFTATTAAKVFSQTIEGTALYGKELTFSILSADMHELVFITLTAPASGARTQATYTFQNAEYLIILVADDGKNLSVQAIRTPLANTDYSLSVAAVKLELGPIQTLARNVGTEANPQWVLNDPPPNFGAELLKCQRYLQPIVPGQADGGGFFADGWRMVDSKLTIHKSLHFNPPMYQTPTLLNTLTSGGNTNYGRVVAMRHDGTGSAAAHAATALEFLANGSKVNIYLRVTTTATAGSNDYYYEFDALGAVGGLFATAEL